MAKITGTSKDDNLQGTALDDVINGLAGADTMTGGNGADTYVIDNVGDKAIEGIGGGNDTVISTIALTNSIQYVENYIFNTKANLSFLADDANNEIHGGSGNDVINADDGLNWVYGNAGNDTMAGGSDVDNLNGGIGNDLLMGAGGMDTLEGGAGDDILESGTEDDVLNGGTGKDQMTGGDGSDTYRVDNVGDEIHEQMGGGLHDLVRSTITITELAKWVEDGQLEGAAALDLTGNSLDNSLGGNTGANVIDGGAGADLMAGGKGGDTYVVDNVLDKITEYDGQGIDLVKSSVSYTLAADIENLTLTGLNNIAGTGNDLNNIITGNDGANVLDGGKGADKLSGGKGDDYYVVDNAGDKVVEMSNAAGGGHDHVYSSVSLSLAALANVEDIVLTGNGDIDATGNALVNYIQGNGGDNHIDGGKGADVMEGYDGDDTYHVDNLGDTVIEAGSGGRDWIISSVNFSGIVANVENYSFNVATAVHFTGDAADNEIHGGSGNDTIDGGDGLNYLLGFGGNDTLIGGKGGDTVWGGTGADKMMGGDGSDSYTVDNLGDVVTELAGQGTHDMVFTSVSLAKLFDNVEDLQAQFGTGALTLTGNDLDNSIGGNAGANKISGGLGMDTLNGMHGNDTLTGDAGQDTFKFDLDQYDKSNDGHDTVTDFLKAEDVLSFNTGDVNNDGNIDLNDLLADVSKVVDHGAGKAVDVFFNNGAEISFAGCGTGAVNSIDDLVANAATQIHVS